MKKAKFLLVAAGVLAVAGSALASFAKSTSVLYARDGEFRCKVPVTTFLTTVPNQNPTVLHLSVAPTEVDCTTTLYVTL